MEDDPCRSINKPGEVNQYLEEDCPDKEIVQEMVTDCQGVCEVDKLEHFVATADFPKIDYKELDELIVDIEYPETIDNIGTTLDPDDYDVIGNNDRLEVGTFVDSVEEAKARSIKHGGQMFASLRVKKNDKSRLEMACKHARYRPSQASGERKHQHFQYTGCQAKIKFTKLLNGCLKCILVEDEHNHPLTEDDFNYYNVSLSVQEKETLKLLNTANVKTGKIQRTLEKKNCKLLL